MRISNGNMADFVPATSMFGRKHKSTWRLRWKPKPIAEAYCQNIHWNAPYFLMANATGHAVPEKVALQPPIESIEYKL